MLAKNTANINNIKLFRGVWNKDCYLKVEPSKTGAWGFTVRECDKINADVDAYSIPSIMTQCKFPHIDILKMDIEGSEFFVFNDEQCFEWLRKTKCLIIECHDNKVQGCWKIVNKRMSELGYIHTKVGEDIVFYKNLTI